MGASIQGGRLQGSLRVSEGRAAAAIEVIERHMAAEDRQDVEATVATFTEDCYYRVPGLGIELRGREQIAGWYRELFAAVPDFRNADERCYPAGDMVFFEALMEGTHLGDWVGWAPTGKRFSVPMLVRIPIAEDGLLEAEIVYFDSAALFMQLGILPALGSRQERAMQRLHRLRRRLSRR
jgi:steroid delta-isomerase-like uncharacterized protein